MGLLVLGLILCAGCAAEPAAVVSPTPEPEPADAALYRQLGLYIRRGLRDYGLPGEYTLSFGPVEEAESAWYGPKGTLGCPVAVEGGDGIESYGYYTVDWDPEADWYTFNSQVEHFLVQEKEKDWHADGYGPAKAAAVYTFDLDTEAVPVELERFDTPPVPVETTFHHWNSFDSKKSGRDTYHYVDRRLGVELMGEYPNFYPEDKVGAAFYQVMEDFFFGVTDLSDDARKSPFTTLELTYRMTREDEDFASARFHHDAYTRGAAHPSDWETCVTVDRETGQVLTLDDVLDWDGDAATLLEGYDWKPSWTWEGGSERDELDYLIQVLKDGNGWISGFYLTEDRLGLIVGFSRYYTPVECPLSDLPIKLDKLR